MESAHAEAAAMLIEAGADRTRVRHRSIHFSLKVSNVDAQGQS